MSAKALTYSTLAPVLFETGKSLLGLSRLEARASCTRFFHQKRRIVLLALPGHPNRYGDTRTTEPWVSQLLVYTALNPTLCHLLTNGVLVRLLPPKVLTKSVGTDFVDA